MPLSSMLFQGAGHHKLSTDLCAGASSGTLSTQLAPCGAALLYPFHGMVGHVDKHCSPCGVYLSKRSLLVTRSHLVTDICHHLKLITVFVWRNWNQEQLSTFCALAVTTMLICICRYLNAFEKGTFFAFWWTPRYDMLPLSGTSWCLLFTIANNIEWSLHGWITLSLLVSVHRIIESQHSLGWKGP